MPKLYQITEAAVEGGPTHFRTKAAAIDVAREVSQEHRDITVEVWACEIPRLTIGVLLAALNHGRLEVDTIETVAVLKDGRLVKGEG